MKLLKIIILPASAFLLAGCASIVSKSDYPVSVGSTPADAEVTITNNRTGQVVHRSRTPVTVTLAASDGYFKPASYTVDIRKDGYEATSRTIHGRLDGWYIGNIVFGGLIGWLIVDPLTGAMYRLDPRNLDTDLARGNEETADDRDTPALRLLALDEVPAEMRSALIRID